MATKDDVLKNGAGQETLNLPDLHLQILDDLPEFVVRFTPEGEILFANQTYCNYFQQTRENLVGTNLFIFLPEEERDSLKDHFNSLTVRNPKASYEKKVCNPDGTITWHEWTTHGIFKRTGEVVEFQSTGRDITDSKIDQEELQKLSLVAAKTDAVVVMTDSDGYTEWVNDGFVRLTGFQPEEVIGKKPGDILQGPDTSRATVQRISRQLKSKKSFQEEILNYTKSGEPYWLHLDITPILNNDGEVERFIAIETDITSKKQAEQQLKNFKKLFDISIDPMCLAGFDGFFKKVNPAFVRTLGYTEKELLSKPFIDFVHADDVESTLNEAAKLSDKNLNAIGFVNRYRTKSGDYRYFSWNAVPEADKELMYCVVRDITESRANREELRKSEVMLKESQKIAKIGSWEVRMEDNEYVVWSDETYRIHEIPIGTKISVEEAINYYDESSRKIISKAVEKAINEGEAYDLELTIITAKGNKKRVRAKGNVETLNGEPVKIYGVFQDISKESAADWKLKHYQEGLKLLNNIAANINLNFEEQLSSSIEIVAEYLGLPLGIISHIEGDIYTVKKYFSNDERFQLEEGMVFDSSETYCDITFRENDAVAINHMQTSEHKDHPCYLSFKLESYIGAPLFVNGERYGTVNFSGPDKRIELFDDNDLDFMRLLSRWIGSTIERQEIEAAILESKDRAELASEAKQQFLSTMSHEIRTPMNAVVGVSQLLLDDDPKENQLELLNTLQFSAQNLMSLINDILDYNKIESGKIELEEIDFDLADLITGIFGTFKHKAEEKNLVLEVDYDPTLPKIFKGDPVRISQVLNNLVGNAIKFTDTGSVQLKASKVDENYKFVEVDIEVTDTGIGIPEDKMELIFERFSQANLDTTRIYGGSGLGLTITKKLLELHGSDIKVRSTEGKGSTFTFRILMQKGDEGSIQYFARSKEAKYIKDLQGARILLVEDIDTNQMIAKKFLNLWNADVTIAANGLEGIKLLKYSEFDLVLMDLQMPEMDGYEATRVIREELKLSSEELPIIALTASVAMDIRDEVISIGMNGFITKPFNPNDLYNKIAKPLNLKMERNPEMGGSGNGTEERLIDVARILELAAGSKEFIHELSTSYIEQFETYHNEYARYLRAGDHENFRLANHAQKPGIKFLKIASLEEAIQTGKELIGDEGAEENRIERNITLVQNLCDRIIRELREFLSENS